MKSLANLRCCHNVVQCLLQVFERTVHNAKLSDGRLVRRWPPILSANNNGMDRKRFFASTAPGLLSTLVSSCMLAVALIEPTKGHYVTILQTILVAQFQRPIKVRHCAHSFLNLKSMNISSHTVVFCNTEESNRNSLLP